MFGSKPTLATDVRARRWPLIAIAAPAFVATWSGWVGLGEKRIRIAGDEDAPLPLSKALEILRAAQALGMTDSDVA